MLLAMIGLPATRAGDEDADDTPTAAALQARQDDADPGPGGDEARWSERADLRR
jgi:hypothetical protein